MEVAPVITSEANLTCLKFGPFVNDNIIHFFLAKPNHSEFKTGKTHLEVVNGALRALSLPIRPVISLQQVHGNRTLILDRKSHPTRSSLPATADALFTSRNDLYLTVRVADCLPIYVYDADNQIVGLIHAGWRGTLLGIAQRALQAAQAELGLNPAACAVLLGPCIKSCCYQISAEVALLFSTNSISCQGQKHYLDLCKVNKEQLLKMGVEEKNIHQVPDCTFCKSDLYYSYRRSQNKNERMYAVLGLR
jgi:hypothetical protein